MHCLPFSGRGLRSSGAFLSGLPAHCHRRNPVRFQEQYRAGRGDPNGLYRHCGTGRPTMSTPWQYQIRVNLNDEYAELARNDPGNLALKALTDILNRHHATLKCQLDAFIQYVAEAEEEGVDKFPLYKWTKATLEDPEKRAKHSRSFTLHVRGYEVYPEDTADALAADLKPLVGGPFVTRLSKHDTNPANNLPIPAEYRS
jgi:hypothetical protein